MALCDCGSRKKPSPSAILTLAREKTMASVWMDLLEKITDEASFLRFLAALREDCEQHERSCRERYMDCAQADHWETRSTSSFLRSVEDWASGGDFAAGVHHGEPLLRRFATMLFVGRYFRSDERPYRS
jgi:hypothetical protein